MAILGVFAILDIVGGVAVAEPLREDLVEHRLFDPRRLIIIRQQDKVISMVRQVGGDVPLGVEIDRICADKVKVVLDALLGDTQRGWWSKAKGDS